MKTVRFSGLAKILRGRIFRVARVVLVVLGLLDEGWVWWGDESLNLIGKEYILVQYKCIFYKLGNRWYDVDGSTGE
jgi:hypothetical protein